MTLNQVLINALTGDVGPSTNLSDRLTQWKLELTLLCGFVVVVANDSRNLPCAIFALPQVNELRLANALCGLLSRVVKAMNTDLDCAIALHGVHLQSATNKCSWHFAGVPHEGLWRSRDRCKT